MTAITDDLFVLSTLQQATKICAGCALMGVNAVFGEGPAPAYFMFVGEAPGFYEAKSGRPFVGPAGEKLDVLLKLAGLKREECYITNVVKHRPSANRKPLKREQTACSPFLEQELRLVQPAVVIALGDVAAKWFDKDVRLAKDHGVARAVKRGEQQFFLVPVYHPAFALRNAGAWAMLVQDFHSLRAELERAGGAHDSALDYRLVSDFEATTFASSVPCFGFDVETTAPKRGRWFAVQEAQIVGYSVAVAPNTAFYVDGAPAHMSALLQSPLYEKVCHNAKFEYGRLHALGITLASFQCTKIAAWLLQHPSTHLKSLARQLLRRDPLTYAQVTQGREMSELLPAEIVEYAAADADNALQLWSRLARELEQNKLMGVYERVELPLVPVLDAMEARGVGVDEHEAQAVHGTLQQASYMVYASAYGAGLPTEYDHASTSQLAVALKEMGAPIRARTAAKGQLKTDAATLESVRAWNTALIDAVLDYRTLRKMGSYVSNFLTLRGADGRLHPQFIQAGDVSETVSDKSFSAPPGRLACSAPNLQNVPHHGRGHGVALVEQWAPRIRRCIVPRDGYVFVSGDIAQEEPRITAFVAHETAMQADFDAGVPIYAPMGEAIYGYSIGKSSHPREWHTAKTNFLKLVYGGHWSGLLELDPTLTREAAHVGYTRLMQRYPRLRAYAAQVREELYENGFVRDWFGRVRWIPKVYSSDGKQREEGYREGVNFTIQGPAASVIKLAMQRVHAALQGHDAFLVLSVHDELVVECLPGEVPYVASVLRNMTRDLMPIELPVELKTGANWGEMKELA